MSKGDRPPPVGRPAGPSPRHILHVFPSFGYGGAPIRICNIINHFGQRLKHTIVATDGCYDCRARIHPEVQVDLESVPVSKYGLFRNIFRFRATISAVRPDLLLTYNWGAIEWALANNLSPICRNVHLESGFGVEEADRQLRRRVLFRRVALARTSCVIVPSRNLADIATRIWKLDVGHVVYIPNGVDCRRFASSPVSGLIQGFTKAPGELIVGTVAPLRPEKKLQRLLHAFSAVADRFDARLLIVGDGPELPHLRARAADLGIEDRVLFAGHVDEVEKVLGWLDIFALSSDTEQMPNSLLQAMAAGRPVVAVDVGDVKEIVAPENRPFIVPRDDARQFRGGLERLLGDASERARLGRLNQARVRKYFSEERMFSAYEAVLMDRS